MPRWCKAFGNEFTGQRLPFGCRVIHRPSPTRDLTSGKWDPVTSAGVFAGYKLRPGSHWSEEYLVWDLTDFVEFDLSDVCSTLTHQLRNPHVTGRVSLYKDTLSFPLRDAYDEARATLHGVRRTAAKQGAIIPEQSPPLDQDDHNDQNISAPQGRGCRSTA